MMLLLRKKGNRKTRTRVREIKPRQRDGWRGRNPTGARVRVRHFFARRFGFYYILLYLCGIIFRSDIREIFSICNPLFVKKEDFFVIRDLLLIFVEILNIKR